jgi:DNA-binding transcriptional ArsR family regulator
MAQAKEHAFSEEDRTLAALGSALAHPARVVMLRRMHREGWVACSSLFATLPLAQPTLSRHLKVLRDLGLVEARGEGLTVHYRLAPAAFNHAWTLGQTTFASDIAHNPSEVSPSKTRRRQQKTAHGLPSSDDAAKGSTDSEWDVNLL